MSKSESDTRPDIRSTADIEQFVDHFYAALLADPVLAPIFVDVARIDLSVHKPLICQYWAKLLLGGEDYQRHTMNIHRAVDGKRKLRPDDFKLWLDYFARSMDALFRGPTADKAVKIATTIAQNMNKAVGNAPW